MTTELLLLYGSILVIIGILISRASFKLGLPTLLLFLAVGIMAGSSHYIDFNNPELAQGIGVVALTIILFSGGMDTDFKDIRPVLVPGGLLATLGVFLTASLTGGFIYYLFQWIGDGTVIMTFPQALLMGAVMSSTDSASVFSILRTKDVSLKHKLKPLLEFESGSNDPMAYMLTIILVQMLQSGEISIWLGVGMFFQQFILGGVLGYLYGKLAVWFLNRINLHSSSLYSILLLAIACFIFATTNFVGGNGYLAVYLSGLVVGNSKVVNRKSMMRFFDGFQWLCQLIMFLTLGLLVNATELISAAPRAIAIAAFLMLFGRPIAVSLTLLPFIKQYKMRAQAYVSAIGLRGAVPIIFAIYPWVAGLQHAQMIFNIVFFITLLSLTIQGSIVTWLAQKLDLVDENKKKGVFSDVDLPENIKSTISEIVVSSSMIESSDQLKDLPLPDHTLAILVQRDGVFFIPMGNTRLQIGDHVLMISDDQDALVQAYEELGIQTYSLERNA